MYAVMWSEHCSYKSSPHPPRRLPDRGAVGARRPGRGRRRHRRRRRPRGRDPHREPQPPVGGRALPGRGDRRRRHHPRHLLDGRAADRADGPAAVRPARRPPHPLDRRGRRSRHQRLRQRGRRADRRRRGRVRRDATATTRSSTCCASACCRPSGWCSARAEGVGNLAVLLGSSTGRDGIGGASVLASAGFDEGDAEAKRPCVQVGDPFEEKRLIEACLELLDAGSRSACRTSAPPGSRARRARPRRKGGVGMDVDVAAVPRARAGHEAVRGDDVREPGADARDRRRRRTSTRCSRSATAGRSGHGRRDASPTRGAAARCSTGLDGAVLGRRARGVARTTTAPLYDRPRTAARPGRPTRQPTRRVLARAGRLRAPSCSRCSPTPSWVWRQYDHQLFLNTVEGPGGDAAVLRLKHPTTGRRHRPRPRAHHRRQARCCALDPRHGHAPWSSRRPR